MAVVIDFASLVIPLLYLDEGFPGGVDAYYELCDAPNFIEDEHLTRVSFMATHSAIEIVEQLRGRGFPAARDFAPTHAIVDLSTAPEAVPAWLSIGVVEGWSCAWWSEAPPGEVVASPRTLALRDLEVNPERFREQLRRRGIEWEQPPGGGGEGDVDFVGYGLRVEAFVFQDPPGGLIKGLLTHLPRCRHVDRGGYEKILESLESILKRAERMAPRGRWSGGETENTT